MSLTCIAHRMPSSVSCYASKIDTLKTSPCSVSCPAIPNYSQFPKCVLHSHTSDPERPLPLECACLPTSFPQGSLDPNLLLYSTPAFPPSHQASFTDIVGCHGVVSGCLSSRGIQSTLSVDNGFSALHPMNWHTQPFSAAQELSCVV